MPHLRNVAELDVLGGGVRAAEDARADFGPAHRVEAVREPDAPLHQLAVATELQKQAPLPQRLAAPSHPQTPTTHAKRVKGRKRPSISSQRRPPGRDQIPSPPILAAKKDPNTGEYTDIRFCVDFRHINRRTRRFTYRNLTPDQLFRNIGKARFITTVLIMFIIFSDPLERPYLYGLWLMYYNVLLMMASRYMGPNKATYVNMYTNGVKRSKSPQEISTCALGFEGM
eukprot:462428-Prorocentrum_minimum.AAC.1